MQGGWRLLKAEFHWNREWEHWSHSFLSKFLQTLVCDSSKIFKTGMESKTTAVIALVVISANYLKMLIEVIVWLAFHNFFLGLTYPTSHMN